MKITPPTLSRKMLFASITVTIIIAVSALFLYYFISTKRTELLKLLDTVELDQSDLDHAMLLLRQSEDYFQDSLFDQYDGKAGHKIIAYKMKLSQAFNVIESVVKKKPDTSKLTFDQSAEMWKWYQRKLQLSRKLYVTRHVFNYLLTATLEANTKNQMLLSTLNFHAPKKSFRNYMDTSKKAKPNKKRAFLGRIKDAFLNQNNKDEEVVEINRRHVSEIVDSVTRKIIVRDESLYERRLKQLQQANIKIMGTQRKLIMINMGISSALTSIINDTKEINYKIMYDIKYTGFARYEEMTLLINKFLLGSVFAMLIDGYILFNLYRSKTLLLVENERSVRTAQQKMNLLLYMSHEVRTPLTAIRSFLHALGKTNLSHKQKEVLKSIGLSSDMLLYTLNDTLDAAKMESSEFKINNAPFKPDLVFREVIESLGYGATKKNLTIKYHIEGGKNIVVLGDELRLKQILFNLLSNAIKYTQIGTITIVANLLSVKGNYALYVDITDTGEGINPEQQANLFSKYYQTDSALGKIGSGLGLYLCRLLVEMQEGKISVISEMGKGSTFSFYIPYE